MVRVKCCSNKECIASTEEIEIYLDYLEFDATVQLVHDILNKRITVEDLKREYHITMDYIHMTDKY